MSFAALEEFFYNMDARTLERIELGDWPYSREDGMTTGFVKKMARLALLKRRLTVLERRHTLLKRRLKLLEAIRDALDDPGSLLNCDGDALFLFYVLQTKERWREILLDVLRKADPEEIVDHENLVDEVLSHVPPSALRPSEDDDQS
ncbi:hypothetical protein JCM6882_008209 [Rhodosporidiobolus microsporus]